MKMTGTMRAAALTLALAGATAVVPATAAASDASIVAAIERYGPKITTVEGNVLKAVGEYQSSGKDAARVKLAIGKSIRVFRQLEADMARQAARSSRVRTGRQDVEQGLKKIIVSYRRLRAEFGKALSPAVAESDGKHVVHEVLVARRDLQKGLKLLLSSRG